VKTYKEEVEGEDIVAYLEGNSSGAAEGGFGCAVPPKS
jgi:hypothetical protein